MMNQTGPRNYISLTSSAALHIAAAGLMVCGAAQVVPEVAVDSGGQPGLVASISTTLPPPTTLEESQPIVEVAIASDLPNPSLNKAAVQPQPQRVVLSATVVKPRELAKPNYNGTSYHEFTNRPRLDELLRLANGPVAGLTNPRQLPTNEPTLPEETPAEEGPHSKDRSLKKTSVKAQPSPPQPDPKTPDENLVSKSQSKPKATKQSSNKPPQPVEPPKKVSKQSNEKQDSRAGDQSKAKLNGAQVDQLPQKLAGNVAPVYPPNAYRNGDEGVVYLLVEINAKGSVTGAKVYRTSGISSLDKAARQAVVQWKFRPGVLNKSNVACRAVVPVRFQIQ